MSASGETVAEANDSPVHLLVAEPERLDPERHAAAQALAGLAEELLTELEPGEVSALVERIHELSEREGETSLDRDLEAIVGPRLESGERVRLAFEALLRGVERRRELLADTVTAPGAARLIGAETRQAPHDRLRAGRLLAVYDRGAWRFPIWQFDPEAPEGVIDGLAAVLSELSELDHYRRLQWLRTPQPDLEGRTPVEALRDGDARLVVMQAREAALG
jgi:Protein of unknown function (DUF2384)